MGLLAPLFALGAGLIVVPWIVHRIRRPEREVVRFSSLMFVPDVRREVIERRRVQHPLLMVLRMVLLFLLALAFTRPYWKIFLEGETPEHLSRLHVILLDTSLSLKTQGVLEEARARAQDILDGLPDGDRVGVVAFARSARVLSPLFDPERGATGAVSDARRAVLAVKPTWEGTDYEAGLQAAEQLLVERGGEDVRRTVHLISDFQAAGVPQSASGWRLSPHIELNSVVVGRGDRVNYAVQALAVQPVEGEGLQVRARVKNWSGGTDRPVRADLVVGDRVVESQALTVLPGHASQVRFSLLSWDEKKSLGGHVALSPDDLPADNRRYFAWNPRCRPRVVVVEAPRKGERWSYDRLIRAAIPEGADLPWQLTGVPPKELDLNSPEIVIVGGVEPGGRFRAYLERGGRLLVVAHRGMRPDGLNQLLEGAGVKILEPRFDRAETNRSESLSWVDLEHRIFHPFRGARFNDFSSIRFYNYFRLDLAGEARSIARFDNGDPAIVDASVGKGRVVIWTGGIEASWTNLAKRTRFLPLLYETLLYLGGDRTDVTEFVVGAAHPPAVEEAGRESQFLDQPGLLRWKEPSGGERVVAVNVVPEESDPAPISISEFEIRLCDAPLMARPQTAAVGGVQEGVIRREYGLWLVGCVLGLLVLESGYAAWLAQQSESDV